MKTYLCRKTVTAAKITRVANPHPARDPLGRRLELTLEDGSTVHVASDDGGHATPGCYFVREFDGQTSVVPGSVFERWHTPILDNGGQVHPESSLPSRRFYDPADFMDAAQVQALGMERERRERRESFDRYERAQIEKNSKQG